MKRDKVVLVILLAYLVTACSLQPALVPPTAAPTSVPTSTPVPTVMPVPPPAHVGMDGLRTLLGYMPYEWVENHPDEPLGPHIQFLDIARMREDLHLPPVSGTDDRSAKLGLLTGLNTQGGTLAASDSTFFDEWGWDIADVDQVLVSFVHDASILLGDFERPEIKERLLEKGYSQRMLGEFTIFNSKTEDFTFGFKSDDTIIMAENESAVEDLIRQGTGSGDSAGQHPSVVALVDHLGGAWGAFMAPGGDVAAFADRVRWNVQPDEIHESFSKIYRLDMNPELGWDFMAIGFWGSEQATTALRFLYHYPSEDEAKKDVTLARQGLTEMPLLTARSRVWGDLLDLQSVQVHGTVLQATATTHSKSLIGSAITQSDLGFLPIRSVLPAIGATLTSTLDSGWTLYKKPSEGFALALPPGWQEVALGSETGDTLFDEMVKDLVSRGTKFYALLLMDMSQPSLTAIANVGKDDLPVEVQLDAYVPLCLETIEKLADPDVPITHRRITLSNVEAEEFRYGVETMDVEGNPASEVIMQYLIADRFTYYVITLSCPVELADTCRPMFQEISQSFQLLESVE